MQHEIVSKNSTELTRWLSGTIGPLERGLGQVLSHQIRDLKPSGNMVHDNVPDLHRLTQQVLVAMCFVRLENMAWLLKLSVDVDSKFPK